MHEYTYSMHISPISLSDPYRPTIILLKQIPAQKGTQTLRRQQGGTVLVYGHLVGVFLQVRVITKFGEFVGHYPYGATFKHTHGNSFSSDTF